MARAKILIVDDDPDIVDAMRLVLEANDYAVACAYSAQDGLDAVVREKPDLMVLDVMMERDTDGFHVAYKIKNAPADSELAKVCPIPILMVTAISKLKGMSFSPSQDQNYLPVDAFVQKPIQPAVLLDRIGELLEVGSE
jgi:CheY-like chemotaxis protein